MQLSESQYTSFYKRIQAELPDPRGVQGKCHELAFVVTTFIIGILVGRKKVSSIHRHMQNTFEDMRELCNYECQDPVSRAQLPRILKIVNWHIVSKISNSVFGQHVIFKDQSKEWVAIDGKEQKGTIRTQQNGQKQKRGLANVRAISHKSRYLVGQNYYEGDKESEITTVRELLQEPALKGRSITLDALHCNPKTSALVVSQKGRYIIEVKENQAELLTVLKSFSDQEKEIYSIEDPLEKGHGRYAKRHYTFYNISKLQLDKRWKASNIYTLIVVDRAFENIKTGKQMQERSFYISNQVICEKPDLILTELAEAVREHWQVENDNQVRDVTFEEDKLRVKDRDLAKVIAMLLSVAMKLFKTTNVQNYQRQIEWFADKKSELFDYLRETNFL